MALPLIAAGIAARAVAKKLATRAAGGIVGAGAKQVNPVYRNMGTGSVKVVPSKGMKRYTGDTDELTMVARPKASDPIRSKIRGTNAIKVTSSTMRSK
jgi:hypothetical protein